MNTVSIKGLNKAAVLAALYNAARPQGMGFLQYNPAPMTEEQARQILDSGQTYFDYLMGRVMKINLAGDEISTFGYNRDNGDNAAEKIIEQIRVGSGVNTPAITELHKAGVLDAAANVKANLHVKSEITEPGVFRLGFDDVADELGAAVDKAIE